MNKFKVGDRFIVNKNANENFRFKLGTIIEILGNNYIFGDYKIRIDGFDDIFTASESSIEPYSPEFKNDDLVLVSNDKKKWKLDRFEKFLPDEKQVKVQNDDIFYKYYVCYQKNYHLLF